MVKKFICLLCIGIIGMAALNAMQRGYETRGEVKNVERPFPVIEPEAEQAPAAQPSAQARISRIEPLLVAETTLARLHAQQAAQQSRIPRLSYQLVPEQVAPAPVARPSVAPAITTAAPQYVQGRYAYVAAPAGLQIFDIENNSSVASIALPDEPHDSRGGRSGESLPQRVFASSPEDDDIYG